MEIVILVIPGALALLGVGAWIFSKAWLARRRGEPYVWGFLDGGLLLMGSRTSPTVGFVLAGVLAAAALGVVAWVVTPVIRGSLRENLCKQVISEKDLRAISKLPTGQTYGWNRDFGCRFSLSAEKGGEAFSLEFDTVYGYDSDVDAPYLARYDKRTLDGFANRNTVYEAEHGYHLLAEHRRVRIKAFVSRAHYPELTPERLAEILRPFFPKIARYRHR